MLVCNVCLLCVLTVPADQKTPNAEPPHHLEDEGLYVGERSKVNWTNQVLVENRLLKREDKVKLGGERTHLHCSQK